MANVASKFYLIKCFFGSFLVTNVRFGFLEADPEMEFNMQDIYYVSTHCEKKRKKLSNRGISQTMIEV